jgi:hypothetical protein
MPLGVMARGSREREAAATRSLDRCARGEERGLEGGLGAQRVPVQEAARRPNLLDELGRVAAEHIGLRRGRALDELEPPVQHFDPLL